MLNKYEILDKWNHGTWTTKWRSSRYTQDSKTFVNLFLLDFLSVMTRYEASSVTQSNSTPSSVERTAPTTASSEKALKETLEILTAEGRFLNIRASGSYNARVDAEWCKATNPLWHCSRRHFLTLHTHTQRTTAVSGLQCNLLNRGVFLAMQISLPSIRQLDAVSRTKLQTWTL